MGLSTVKKIYKPVLNGIGWPGDVKKIALKIDKIKKGIQTGNEFKGSNKNNSKETPRRNRGKLRSTDKALW